MLPPFGWQAVLTDWQFAPVVTAAVVVFAAACTCGARGGSRAAIPPGPGRGGAPGCSWAVSPSSCWPRRAASARTTTCCSGTTWSSTCMLIMIAPPLLVLGQPVTLLLHASRNPLHTWAKRVVRSRVATLPDLAAVRPRGVRRHDRGTHLTGLSR